jgi:hypothetical protein
LGEANEPFDLVIYLAEGVNRGKFLNVGPDGRSKIIDVPNRYRNLSLDQRSIILKIHGAVDRSSAEGDNDSFVITEDHYIDYGRRRGAKLISVRVENEERAAGVSTARGLHTENRRKRWMDHREHDGSARRSRRSVAELATCTAEVEVTVGSISWRLLSGRDRAGNSPCARSLGR